MARSLKLRLKLLVALTESKHYAEVYGILFHGETIEQVHDRIFRYEMTHRRDQRCHSYLVQDIPSYQTMVIA